MNRALRTLGWLALLGWTALGGLAWSALPGRLEAALHERAPDGDELPLLRDRIESLSSDLDALVSSLNENFELLAASVATESDARAVEAARTAERLRQLEGALPAALQARETAGALSAVLARLEGVAEGRRPAVSDEPEPSPSPPIVAETAPAEPAAAVPSETPSKQSFLAFRLPSQDFRFDGVQEFEVLPDLSRVGFDARSTLHDFSGVSNAVEGRFRVDLARPEAGLSGHVSIGTGSLDTDLEGRDEAMREHLRAEEFEQLVFEAEGFEAERVDPDQQRLEGTLVGRMTIRGATLPVRMPVTAHVDESRRLVVEGEMPLSLRDFGIPVPNKLGMISMEEVVRVWIHLRARARRVEAGRG